MTTRLRVTLTDPATGTPVATFGPTDALGADDWLQQLYRDQPDTRRLVPTVEKCEEDQ